MALRIRYRELSGEEWEKKTKKGEQKRDLKNLITWFQNQHYFEVTNDKYLDHVRKVRNSYAHPDRHSFGGPVVRHWIENPMDLINDLYEDCNLRSKRKIKQKELTELFSKIMPSGCILKFGSREYIIYDIRVIFVDNRKDTELIYLMFYPIFLKEDLYPKEGIPNYQLIQAVTNSVTYSEPNDSITLFDLFSQKHILISRLINSDNKKKFEEWMIKANSMEIYPELVSLDRESNKWFSYVRREFHKGNSN